jgi:hypothetical protein
MSQEQPTLEPVVPEVKQPVETKFIENLFGDEKGSNNIYVSPDNLQDFNELISREDKKKDLSTPKKPTLPISRTCPINKHIVPLAHHEKFSIFKPAATPASEKKSCIFPPTFHS